MIEKVLLDYMTEAMGDIPVFMEVPKDRPDTFVVLEKTGSGKTNHLCSATFALQSYAPSMYEAAEVNEKVKTAMENAITLDDVTRCALNSDYNYTDTTSKNYRYQAVFDVIHY